MLWNNEFIGLALEDDYILAAHIKKRGDRCEIVELRRYELAEDMRSSSTKSSPAKEVKRQQKKEPAGDSQTGNAFWNDVFGPEKTESSRKSGDNDIDFEQLEQQAEAGQAGMETADMLEESTKNQARSNPILLYNILVNAEHKNVKLGLNIPTGDTIYQFITDTDFRDVKKKDLTDDLESRLETIYDQPPNADHYAYEIRDDGSLILASVDREAPLIQVANETRQLYKGKLRIRSVYPDEVALVGLLRANYELKEKECTALIQFSADRCRVVFLRGEEIIEVMPVINQGTESTNFLNVVFSKLLFQLDTGKIDNMDRIVLADNTIGKGAVAFFQKNFPDLKVEDFSLDEEKIAGGEYQPSAVRSYTTAIAAAWSASQPAEQPLPDLSFLPTYVQERQKIFKLQWHGLLLLILIFLSIPTFNYFYQQNKRKITSLTSRLELTESRIQQIEPIVQQTNRMSQNLSLLTAKLSLLDSLSAGSKTWSTRLDKLNQDMDDIPSSWFTSMSNTQSGNLFQGYSLYRNRIPAIVNLFADATLLNVSIEERRDKQMYKFSIAVRKFARDSTQYSPEKPQHINQLLNH